MVRFVLSIGSRQCKPEGEDDYDGGRGRCAFMTPVYSEDSELQSSVQILAVAIGTFFEWDFAATRVSIARSWWW